MIPNPIPCAAAEELIDRVQAGEADAAARERLLDHLDGCASCSELFDLVGRVGAGRGEDAPGELELARDLAAMRRSVLASLAEQPLRAPRASQRRGWRPALAIAASFALAAIGFALGAGWRTEELPLAGAAPSGLVPIGLGGGPLAVEVRAAAARHETFEEISDSPFVFANVRAEPQVDGRVRLAFDVSRHLDLTVDRDDPLLAEALVQSLVGTGELGSRLAAIDLAGDRLEPRVEEALRVAMRDDENLGVRLKAQERLAAAATNPAIVDAMLDVLASEDAVQMRLVAIDYLTAHRVEPGRLERALDAVGAAADPALQVRAAHYLQQSR